MRVPPFRHMDISEEFFRTLRTLRRQPLYAAAGIATLALGVAALTLAYTFVNAFLFRPLPFRADHELVGISTTHVSASGAIADFAVSSQDYLAFAHRSRTLAGSAAINSQTYAVVPAGSTEPLSIRGAAVSASMWTVLGTGPIAGRVFDESEDRADVPVVVISHALQRRLFPGDASAAIGSSMSVEGVARTVIGVMPTGYRPRMNPGDLWLPLGVSPAAPNIVPSRQLQMVSRLKPGITLAQARGDLERVARQLETEFPQTNRDWGVSVKNLRTKLGDSARAITLALLAAVVFLLLLTCANMANLAVARVARRRVEFATRLALGSRPSAINRTIALESLVLACAGTILGLLLAASTVPLAIRLLTSDNPLISLVSIDWRVVTLAASLSLVLGTFAGTVPAMYAARFLSRGSLTSAVRGNTAGVSDKYLRRSLMTLQVAAAAILLVGSLGALSALRDAARSEIGYDPARLTVGTLRLPASRYPRLAERVQFADQVLEKLRATPGVERAGLTTSQFLRDNNVQTVVAIDGAENPAQLTAELRRAGGDYFQTMRIGLVAGRYFTPADRDSAPLVALVNHAFVRQYLGSQEPLGVRIRRSANVWTIVGVVPDVRDGGRGEDLGAIMYVPYAQNSSPFATFVIASRLPVGSAERVLRDAVAAVDPGQPFDRIAPASRLLFESLGEERFQTLVLAALAALALMVACVGIYSVTAYLIQAGAREIAIRLAMGARRPTIMRHFVRDTLAWVVLGAVAGLVVTWLFASSIGAWFPALQPPSPATFVAIAVLLAAVGTLSAAVPSFRAGSMDPADVFRRD